MIIESVDLKDYRNYKILNMNFNPQINIIYGDNAQGKTNILEALYVCATSRSHKGSKDRGRAGTSAPGHALYLVDVTYPEELFQLAVGC